MILDPVVLNPTTGRIRFHNVPVYRVLVSLVRLSEVRAALNGRRWHGRASGVRGVVGWEHVVAAWRMGGQRRHAGVEHAVTVHSSGRPVTVILLKRASHRINISLSLFLSLSLVLSLSLFSLSIVLCLNPIMGASKSVEISHCFLSSRLFVS